MSENNQILKNIKQLAPKHCDNCGNKYFPVDFQVLRITDSNVLVHLNCPKCGNTYVINAFMNQNGLGSQRMPMVIDFESTKEIEKFASEPAVTKDDVIDMYNFLNENPSLERLFADGNVDNQKNLNLNNRISTK